MEKGSGEALCSAMLNNMPGEANGIPLFVLHRGNALLAQKLCMLCTALAQSQLSCTLSGYGTRGPGAGLLTAEHKLHCVFSTAGGSWVSKEVFVSVSNIPVCLYSIGHVPDECHHIQFS